MAKITVIDYGLSNLLSVCHAFEYFGAKVEIADTPEQILNAEALVLPGVGAFADGMAGLERLDLIDPICRKAKAGTPLLGICLGMQMLFEKSEEFGLHKGLGLIAGRVVRIPDTDSEGNPQKVPHISWNPLYYAGGHADWQNTLLQTVRQGEECYFIHSYEAKPTFAQDCLAETIYGGRRICAVAAHKNVIGTQFHPEKSGTVGLKIIEQYLKLCK